MFDSFIEFKEEENICSVKIENKNQYYEDLLNIEHSWSGRMDANICNTFIMEAEQLLVNAIVLFEQGYFDCAYYSLRSAVELSTTMVFLIDMPENERNSYLDAWKSLDDFPMRGQIVKELTKYGEIFKDMLRELPEFFEGARELSNELNKYVHKQGFQLFYVSRNHPFSQMKSNDLFVATFEKYIQRCIGVVAVMRLAIDPFPVLPMDEEILYRCFDSMTEPYSREFVDKYIGFPLLEKYKQTEFYKTTYNSFADNEKKNEATFNVLKHHYIDSKKLSDIYLQFHLLPKCDVICVMLVAANEKVVKTYCLDGLNMYFTDRNTNRTLQSWSGMDFIRFKENEISINQQYDEAYISVFVFEDEAYYIEHNEPIAIDESKKIVNFVQDGLKDLNKK